MAIYRHVRNKSHLLDLMVERLLDQVDRAPAETTTWQDRLRRLLTSFQALVAAHPATALLLSRPFVSPAALRVSEALLATLRSAGFDAGQSVRLLQVITGMVLGPAIIAPRGRRLHAIFRRTPTASRRPWKGCPLASSPTSRAPRTSSWIGPRGRTPIV
jgi:AcrR family transcriptional regulator